MTSSLQSNEDPVSERKKLYISERQIPALFEVDIRANGVIQGRSCRSIFLLGSDDRPAELRTG